MNGKKEKKKKKKTWEFSLTSPNACLFHVGACERNRPGRRPELRLRQQQCGPSFGARRWSLHQVRWWESPRRQQQQIQHIFRIYYLRRLIMQQPSLASRVRTLDSCGWRQWIKDPRGMPVVGHLSRVDVGNANATWLTSVYSETLCKKKKKKKLKAR